MKHKLIIRKIQLYKLGYGDKPKELEVLDKNFKNLTKEIKGNYYFYNKGDKTVMYHNIVDSSISHILFIDSVILAKIRVKFIRMAFNDELIKWYVNKEYNLIDISSVKHDAWYQP